MNQARFSDTELVTWSLLFRIAGFSTIAMVVIIPIQIVVFSLTPIPTSIEQWFSLFQSSWLLGLIHQDLLYILNNILVAIMYLAFYITLRPYQKSLTTVAVLLGYLGIAVYPASNRAFELLKLSGLYEAAVSEAEKTMLLSAGQALLAGWQGSAFNTYYILNGITLILLSCVMLKTPVYGRKTAWIGLIAGILMMIPSTAGTVGLIFSLASLIPWLMFSVLIANRFFSLSKPVQDIAEGAVHET